MLTFERISHNPAECMIALGGAGGPIYIDTETTGVKWSDQIVSVGLLVDGVIFILFVRSHDQTVQPYQITLDQLRAALSPLTIDGSQNVVFHNAVFDLLMLRKDGIRLQCEKEDTYKLLKLIDPDRGFEPDDKEQTGRSVTTISRWDRHFEEQLNYKLKDVVRHSLSLNAPSFPGKAAALDYATHVNYLASDLLITRALHLHLKKLLSPQEAKYYSELVAPVTSIVVDMTFAGVRSDQQFINDETKRLKKIGQDVASVHHQRFGVRPDVSDHSLRHWLFLRLGCQPRWDHKQVKTEAGVYVQSLEREQLLNLHADANSPAARRSISLILDFKLAKSLESRLGALAGHIQADRRIHSGFNDIQASGRITSKTPNLQQLANLVAKGQQKHFLSDEFSNVVVRSRNALVASPGHILVAFDIAQADVRCLAHSVESFNRTDRDYLRDLQSQYESPAAWQYEIGMWDFLQPWNRGTNQNSSHFDPDLPCQLADDFRLAKDDFYTVAATRMLGKPPKNKTERDQMKRTILGIVNGMSAATLAQRLGKDVKTAKDYLVKFDRAYPQVAAFTDLMKHGIATSGTAVTFAGRPRRITPHWWMVTQSFVDLFISYKNSDKLWVRVVPLRGSRHVLSCHVLRVIDAKRGSPREGQEIYNDHQGRISTAPYQFFDDEDLIFRLPMRNIPWKIVRRVRTQNEEVQYEGFDRVRRQLFNHLCQGATADVVKKMMIRSLPVCQSFGARMLLQIHDELVFEVPEERIGWFVRRMRQVLEEPPTEDFKVPIVVEPKIGKSFGELHEIPFRQTELPSPYLKLTVKRLLAAGHYRHLRRLIVNRLAGKEVPPESFDQCVVKGVSAKHVIRQILSTYQ